MKDHELSPVDSSGMFLKSRSRSKIINFTWHVPEVEE